MMKTINFADARVVAVRASGHISTEDYEQVLIPAIETALARFSRVRLLYVVEDFEGFAPLALWDDAKIGVAHFHDFEKVAVVTDQTQLVGAVKLMAFAMPCPVRVFGSTELKAAQTWIEQETDGSGLRHELVHDQRILVIEPRGRLRSEDFEQLSRELGPIIAERGGLDGLLIEADHFPGWSNLGGLLSHLRFVAAHHRKVRRLALVTNDPLLRAGPALAGALVEARVKRFARGEREAALAWLTRAGDAAADSATERGSTAS
jgi:hypothetical protein